MRKIILLPLLLCLGACTTDQVTATLELAVDAAISASNVVAPQDVIYENLVLNCLNNAQTILDSATLTPLQQGEQVTAGCLDANLAGTKASAAVQDVITAVANFLKQVSLLKAQIQLDPKFANALFDSKQVSINHGKLKQIKKKLETLKKKLGK
jgi:hypothetical protein